MIELDREQKNLRGKLSDTSSTLHQDIVKLVRDRFTLSYRHMQGRYDAWRKSERQHLAYVDPNEVDSKGQKIFTQARDIIVPYTYAVVQTRLTFFFFSMLGKTPVVPIVGRGPNDFAPAKIMEVVQDYQFSETKSAAVEYCFLQDCERYGMGIMRNVWSSIEEERWSIVRKPLTLMGYKLYDRLIRERSRINTYEGNLPTNISPYNFFPDPRVNVTDVKNMEFCGHRVMKSYNYLKKAEENGEYFNIDKIPLISKDNQSKTFEAEKINNESDLSKIVNMTAMNSLIGDPSTNATKDASNIKLDELEVRLIPRDHQLNSRAYPQEYLITVANDQTVIKCEPLIYPEFSYYVGESNHDYASPANLSTVDMCNGLSDQLSWLFNSHMANVRKIINNSMIVDPSRVEIKDLLDSAPVKIIRLKEEFWGVDGAIEQAIKQLQVNDITRAHIQDSQIVMNLIQRVSAATDNIMGMVEEVKRTATETSSTINLATARLKLTAMLYFVLAIKPMFKAQVHNNQGLLTEDRYYKITDDVALALDKNPEEIKNRLFVSPDQLYGNFDFDVPSFDIPVDKGNMAKVWQGIIKDVVSNPVLSNKFDIVPMFNQMVYNMGVTNVKDFQIKTKIMPDEKVEQMAKDGSLAPLNDVAKINRDEMLESLMQQMNGTVQ